MPWTKGCMVRKPAAAPSRQARPRRPPPAAAIRARAKGTGASATRKSGSFCRTSFSASSSTVRFRRPRKSILSSPSSSSVVMGYWQTTDSSFMARGTYS